MAVAGQWSEESALEEISPFRDEPGGLLSALRALQSCFGAIDERAIGLLAEIFNLSRSEVHGVVSFYHDFRSVPPGIHTSIWVSIFTRRPQMGGSHSSRCIASVIARAPRPS